MGDGQDHLSCVQPGEVLVKDANPVQLEEEVPSIDEVQHQVQLARCLHGQQEDLMSQQPARTARAACKEVLELLQECLNFSSVKDAEIVPLKLTWQQESAWKEQHIVTVKGWQTMISEKC